MCKNPYSYSRIFGVIFLPVGSKMVKQLISYNLRDFFSFVCFSDGAMFEVVSYEQDNLVLSMQVSFESCETFGPSHSK